MPTPRRRVTVATSSPFALSEGPLWDSARNRLLWVDIIGGAVLEAALGPDGVLEDIARHDFQCMVGAVAFADDGTLLVAAQEHLVILHRDGSRHLGPRVVPAGTGRRLNDGAVDPSGCFLIGTLAIDGGSQAEQLVRLERDGSLTVLDDDLTLSNGLAWSVDGSRLFSVDTLRRTVLVRDYPEGDGRRTHLTFEDGYPDGITVDSEDHLWVALWGLGAVHRYSPSGELVDRIEVPAPHTSSVTFAGDDLRTLVVTTAFDQLTDEQRRAFPDSGKLFTTCSDVAGVAPTPWANI